MEAPGCGDPWAAFSSGAVEAYPTLENKKIKCDKTYVEAPGCGDPWAAFSRGAVEAYTTLEYQKIKSDKTYVEAPWLWTSLGNYPACPVLNLALLGAIDNDEIWCYVKHCAFFSPL